MVNFLTCFVTISEIFVDFIFLNFVLSFQTIWPESIEAIFNMYRVGVFFWILGGLVWLGGVISIITELIRARGTTIIREPSQITKTSASIEEICLKTTC